MLGVRHKGVAQARDFPLRKRAVVILVETTPSYSELSACSAHFQPLLQVAVDVGGIAARTTRWLVLEYRLGERGRVLEQIVVEDSSMGADLGKFKGEFFDIDPPDVQQLFRNPRKHDFGQLLLFPDLEKCVDKWRTACVSSRVKIAQMLNAWSSIRHNPINNDP